MEKKQHLYIVSFGSSDKFRLQYHDSKEALGKSQQIVGIEKELEGYVKEKLPMAKASYFTTPVIIEVDPSDEGKYASYPELNEKAVEKLKQKVLTEVEDMEDLRNLSRNAPWSNV